MSIFRTYKKLSLLSLLIALGLLVVIVAPFVQTTYSIITLIIGYTLILIGSFSFGTLVAKVINK